MFAEVMQLSAPLRSTLTTIEVLILVIALLRAPWRQLFAVPERQHLLFGAVLFLVLLWRLRVPFGVGELHLLGLTAVTLLLGPMLALLVGSAALLATALLDGSAPGPIAATAVLQVGVPVLLTWVVLRFAVRYGPRNLYVYLLGAGFLGGAASMLGCQLAMIGLLWLSGARAAVSHWSPELLVVLMYPEGFVNGTLVTVLAVYVPGWMKTFDDHHFLPR